MSLLSTLKNVALGAYHQVNPFDNGQTYSSVQQQKKKKLQPAPPPPTVRAPQIRQQAQPQRLLVQQKQAPAAPKIPAPPQIKAPSVKSSQPKKPSFLQKVGAQLNPFDNGATFKNPKPVQKTVKSTPGLPAPTNNPQVPRVIQQQNAAQAQIKALASMDYNTRKKTIQAAQKDPTNVLPQLLKQNGIDVNNPQDAQFSKVMAQIPGTKEHAAANSGGGAGKVISAAGKFLFGNTAKLANETLELGAKTGDLTAALTAAATHNKQAEANAIKAGNSDTFTKKGQGIFGVGGFKTDEELNNESRGQFAKDIVGGGVGVSTEVLPWLHGAKEVGAATKGAEDLSKTQKLVKGATKTAKVVGGGAGYGVAGSASQQLVEKGNIDPKETFKQGLIGGATAGLAHGGTSVVDHLIQRGLEPARAQLAAHLIQNPDALNKLLDQSSKDIVDNIPEVAGNVTAAASVRGNPALGDVVANALTDNEQELENSLRALMPGASEQNIQNAKDGIMGEHQPLTTQPTPNEEALQRVQEAREQSQQQNTQKDTTPPENALEPAGNAPQSTIPSLVTNDTPTLAESEDRARQLIAMAQGESPEYLQAVKNTAAMNGGQVLPEFENNAVKTNLNRIQEKIAQKGVDPTDVLRSTILHPNPSAGAQDIIDTMKAHGYDVWTNPKTGQPDIDNLYESGSPSGYKHVAMKFTNGAAPGQEAVKELQVMTPEMFGAKKTLGHDIYDVTRALDGLNLENLTPEAQQAVSTATGVLQKLSNDLYDAAGSPSSSIALPTTMSDLTSSSVNGLPKLSARDLSVLKGSLNTLNDPTLSSLDASDVSDLLSKVSATGKTPSEAIIPDNTTEAQAPSTAATVETPPETATNAAANDVTPPATEGTPEANANETVQQQAAKQTPLGFTQSVKASEEVSPEAKAALQNETAARLPNADIAANSTQLVNNDIQAATQKVNQALNKKTGSLSAQEVSDGIALAKRFDQTGSDVAHEQAAQIYDRLAEHLRAAGQEVQAASLLARKTSAGLYYSARKTLNQAGVEITPELDAAMRQQLKAVQASDDANDMLDHLGEQLDSTPLSSPEHAKMRALYEKQQNAVNQREKDIYNFQQVVAQALPKQLGQRLLDGWKGGLLTAPTTTTGNILSNVVESVTTAGVRDPLAVALDKALSFGGRGLKKLGIVGEDSSVGERTKTLQIGGRGGIKQGLKNSKEYMQTGFDARDVGGKYNQVPSASTTSKYPGSVFRFLGAQDQPFWYYNYNRALADQAKASAINQGLKGADREEYIKTFMVRPPAKAEAMANDAAARSTFGNDTMLNSIISKARNATFTDARGNTHSADKIVGFIVPFSRVPAAVATRILERSPVGAVKEVARQIATGHYDQRALVEALSDSAVGTGGALILGSALVSANAITLGYPTDQTTRNQWAAEGKQPYSIRIGNKWISLNYIQPFGSILAAGAQYAQSRKDGKSVEQAFGDATAAAGQSVVGQSFLQGVSGALNAIQQPEQSAQTWLNSTVGSVVPNIVKKIASATDPYQRQTGNEVQAIEAGIPGLRETLPKKTDTFGNPLKSANGFDQLFDPTRPTTAKDTPLLNELDRLKNQTDANGSSYGIFPSKIQKSLTFDGVKTNLTQDQQNELQSTIGQSTQEAWTQLINSDAYKSLSDKDKHDALQNMYDDISAVAKDQFAQKNQLGQYAPGFTGKASKLTAKQDALEQGSFDVSSYASVNGTSMAEGLSDASKQTLTKVNAMPSDKKTTYLQDPKNNYEYQLATYENNLRNGKLSSVQQYKDMENLGKLKVESAYDADTVALYGLSKKQLDDYMQSNTVDQDQVNKLVAMDNALYDAGFISSKKYKTGISGSSSGSGSSSSSKAVEPPTPKFGSFDLPSPPTTGDKASVGKAVSDFASKVGNINVLKNKVAPGKS